jgi:hypothetical protein
VLRVLVRLRKTLVDERTAWQQRLHAVLFHHGLPWPDHALLTQATRGWLEQVTLPQPAACRWRPRCGRSTSSTWSWIRWSVGCAPSPAASLAAGR